MCNFWQVFFALIGYWLDLGMADGYLRDKSRASLLPPHCVLHKIKSKGSLWVKKHCISDQLIFTSYTTSQDFSF